MKSSSNISDIYSSNSYHQNTYEKYQSSINSCFPYSNPRQNEIWELQNQHQNRLNYLTFKARLMESEMMLSESFQKTNNPTNEKVNEISPEEKALIQTLQQEKELLSKAKSDVQNEIDRCKKMLEEFRAQRNQKASEIRREARERKALYSQEIEKLRQKVFESNNHPDIRISIHHQTSDTEDTSSFVSDESDITSQMHNSHSSRLQKANHSHAISSPSSRNTSSGSKQSKVSQKLTFD